MVRRHGPGARGADRLRPASSSATWRRSTTSTGDAQRRRTTCWRPRRQGRLPARNPWRWTPSAGRPERCANACIVWALTESGKDDDLTKELERLAGQAKASKDPYFLSLVADSLVTGTNSGGDREIRLARPAEGRRTSGRGEDEHHRLRRPRLADRDDGPGGAGLAEGQPRPFQRRLQNAVKWISQQRSGYGGFGSTQ